MARAAVVALLVAGDAGTTAAQSRADSAWTAGDTGLAAELYAVELAGGTPSQRALHRLALVRAWSERYDESLELLDRLLAVAPENIEASLDRAKVLSWRNDLLGSVDAYAAIVRKDRTNREARLGLARVLSWDGELRAAEQVYHEMLLRDPTDGGRPWRGTRAWPAGTVGWPRPRAGGGPRSSIIRTTWSC